MIDHGVLVIEEDTALTAPVTGTCAIPVVVGTAPVNMVEDPAAAVNTPILANSAAEAMAALGYVTDFKAYTLCQMMYVTNNVYQISPVVYVNVLDPAKHKKTLSETTATVNQMQAKVDTKGIILNGLTVKAASVTLTLGTDYTTEFDTDGGLLVNLIEGGKGASATSITVSGNVLDPSMVTKEDIIGAYNASTGKESGLEVIRQVKPKLGVVPGLIIAPGWSKIPEVGIAMSAKAANINGVYKATAIPDLDTTKARKYTDCKKVKEDSGFTSKFGYPLWPCAKIGEYILSFSTVAAACIAYTDANNDDIPSRSPSNKLLGITGLCLEDGTEVILDQDQANTVNGYGVATGLNMNGWKLWGNYTGAYPATKDVKDMWLPVRRMFNWHSNIFIDTYFEKVDDPMNPVLIETVTDSENIRLGAYVPDKMAGAEMQYLASDNPITNALAGIITFRQRIAPYTPAEVIKDIVSYDTNMLKSALSGGGE